MQRHFINLIHDQTSNQHLEETMTGLAAQLEFIRRTYPKLETIWMTSDKCSNFKSFNQIPFLVAGNERNWGLNERPFISSRDQRWFRVGKWVFTEAQMGKDDLDCHFSFVRRCFEQYLNVPKMKLTAPAHMYEALTHPTLSIANTHVLLGNTKDDTLAKKIVLPKLKVQSAHEYEYVFKSNKRAKYKKCECGTTEESRRLTCSMSSRQMETCTSSGFKIQCLSLRNAPFTGNTNVNRTNSNTQAVAQD